MFAAWVVFHVITCIVLIVVVLMQSAKGEGLAGGTAFGGGVSGAVFGGRGAASFLTKATTVLAVVFMVNCGALAFMSAGNRPGSADGTARSAVTRKAAQEREAALQRQADLQEAALQDSLSRVSPTSSTDTSQPVIDISTLKPVDTSGN